MTDHLDRVRRAAGIATGSQPSHEQDGRVINLRHLIDARRGGRMDITDLRIPAGVAAAMGVFTAIAYRPAARWATDLARTNDLFVYHWVVGILRLCSADVWAPIVAAFGAVALLAVAIWTRGVSQARAPEITALTTAGVGVTVATAPLAIATILAAAALVVFIALIVALSCLVLYVLLCLISGS